MVSAAMSLSRIAINALPTLVFIRLRAVMTMRNAIETIKKYYCVSVSRM